MAVYRRTYRPYSGRYTGTGSRFLVLTRYGLKSLLDSRPLLAFFVACNVSFVLFMLFIYVSHSPAAQALLQVKSAVVSIDNFFFMKYLIFQGTLSFLITSWVGPGLVSTDLSNDALPLYFARPFSRTEYVLGKFSVIATLLSGITWVPGVILIALQADLAGWDWTAKYYWLIGSMLLGSWLWIALLSLMSLAISAWVKWRIVASAMMLGVFFALAGFGEALDQILRSHWGKLFNLGYLIGVAWIDLFRVERLPMRNPHGELPAVAAWIALFCVAALSLLLLNRKLKAREVVR